MDRISIDLRTFCSSIFTLLSSLLLLHVSPSLFFYTSTAIYFYMYLEVIMFFLLLLLLALTVGISGINDFMNKTLVYECWNMLGALRRKNGSTICNVIIYHGLDDVVSSSSCLLQYYWSSAVSFALVHS